MARTSVLAGAGVAALLAAAPALAEEAIPIGVEFRVSRGNPDYYSYTPVDGLATDPDVTRLPNGQFVVVWQETAQSYAGYEYHQRLEARRFNPDGTGAGQQFTIFQSDVDDYLDSYRTFHPSVAARPDDGFVVVWGDYTGTPPASFAGGIFAQRFGANNAPLAPPVQVSTADAAVGEQRVNEVASDPLGGFAVTWETREPTVMARRFDAAGVPLGPEFAVNTTPLGWFGYPDVGADAGGDFVVVWQNLGLTSPPRGTFTRRFDAMGAPLGPEITVFDHDNNETKNKIAVKPDGDFMVVGLDGPNGGTPGRIFDATDTPVTPEFEVDEASETYTSVTADPDGNFVVTWMDYGASFFDGTLAGRRFSPVGTPLGDRFVIHRDNTNAPFEWPATATDEHGDFVVVWTNHYYDYGYAYQGLWGQRFAVCGNAHVGPDDACDDGNTAALDGCSATCEVETCHTCSGDPSTCSQMPGCTAVCTNPAFIPPNTVALGFKNVGTPLGDEGMAFKGKVQQPPLEHLEWNPSTDGFELALTGTSLVYGIFGTTALPPGPPGGGCDPMRDGWKVKPGSYVYKNASNALPPACIPGSANGVRVVKIKDKLDRDATIQFRVKTRNASMPVAPAPPLTATVILGTSPAAGAAGRCGQITFTGAIGTRFFP